MAPDNQGAIRSLPLFGCSDHTPAVQVFAVLSFSFGGPEADDAEKTGLGALIPDCAPGSCSPFILAESFDQRLGWNSGASRRHSSPCGRKCRDHARHHTWLTAPELTEDPHDLIANAILPCSQSPLPPTQSFSWPLASSATERSKYFRCRFVARSPGLSRPLSRLSRPLSFTSFPKNLRPVLSSLPSSISSSSW